MPLQGKYSQYPLEERIYNCLEYAYRDIIETNADIGSPRQLNNELESSKLGEDWEGRGLFHQVEYVTIFCMSLLVVAVTLPTYTSNT